MNLRKRTSIIVLLAVGLLGSGIAAAAWLVSGTGPAVSQAATAVNLTVTAGTPVASLYPGATGAVHAHVTNPNPFPVRLTGASFGAVTTAPLSGKTCTASNVTTSGPLTLATPINMGAGENAPVTVPGVLQMISTAADGCQGATFTVQMTLSGESS